MRFSPIIALLLSAITLSADVIPMLYDTATKRIVAPTNILGMVFAGIDVTNISTGSGGMTGIVAVASGGTGATNAAGARAAFDLEPGVDIQAFDVDLLALADGTPMATAISNAVSLGAPLVLIGSTNAAVHLALKAPLLSPAFTGTPTAPTASPGSSNTTVATTGFVMGAVAGLGSGSFDETASYDWTGTNRFLGPTYFDDGIVTNLSVQTLILPFASSFVATDASSNLVATSDGGSLTNLNASQISAGTLAEARVDGAIARDAEMAALYQPLDPDLNALAALNGGSLTNLNGSSIASGTVSDSRIDPAIARLASPTFTGTPAAPTASALSSNTVVATTAYADRAAVAAAAAMGSSGGTNYMVFPITSLASTSPADSTTYYVGFTNFRTSYAQAYSVFPISGTVIRYWVRIVTNGTVASAENVDYYLRLNDTTDFGNFTDTWDSAYVEATSPAISQAVSAGDQLAIKIVTPVWTTNPTTAYAFGWVLIEY